MDYTLPRWWKEGDTLRFLYSCKLNPDNTIEAIKQHINWIMYNYGKPLGPTAKKLLYDGSIALISRTKNSRKPIIYIDFKDLETIDKMEDTANTFIYLMFLVREFMNLPGIIEHSVIIMNLREKNSFNIGRTFKLILDIINNSFYAMADQIFLYNMSSSMKYYYKSVQGSLSPFTRESVLSIADTDWDLIDFENPEPFIEGDLLMINMEEKVDWLPHLNKNILPEDIIDNNILRMNRIEPFCFCDKACVAFKEGKNEFNIKDLNRLMSNNVKLNPVGKKKFQWDVDIEADKKTDDSNKNDSYSSFIVKMMSKAGFNCCTQR